MKKFILGLVLLGGMLGGYKMVQEVQARIVPCEKGIDPRVTCGEMNYHNCDYEGNLCLTYQGW